MKLSLQCLVPITATLALTSPAARAQCSLTLEELLPPGQVSDPIFLTAPAGDDRIFVATQEGLVHIVDDGVLLPSPFLDVSSSIVYGTFIGFRGFAFHPDYANNGRFFVWYDTPPAGGGLYDAVLVEGVVSAGDPNVADALSLTELLRIEQVIGGHGGGTLAFGPGGMLYAAIGDGGEQEDPDCNAQNGALLLGKVLRLDVDSAAPYAIPSDNPYVSDPTVLDEIYHLGLRHPWRFSLDRATGDLYIADVGQNTREEIDFAPAGVGGLNFGWKIEEGTTCFSTTNCAAVAPCGNLGYAAPIHDFSTVSANCAVIGGYVYRGPAVQWLQGTYFYSDYCSGEVWSFRFDGQNLTELTDRTTELGGPLGFVVSFGEDAAGEQYIIQQNGRISRIAAASAGEPFCHGDGGDQQGCTDCPCANDAPAGTRGGCINGAGTSAQLLACGLPSTSADTLRVEVSRANPTTFAILASADNRLPNNAANPCFGLHSGLATALLDGLRCVGGNLLRHGARATDANGDIGLANNGWGPPNGPPGGLAAQGGFAAGQTRHFQVFYRADVSEQCGTGQNTTNAMTIAFTP